MCSEYQCKYDALDIRHLPSHLKSEVVLLDGVPVLPQLSNVPALESKEYGGSQKYLDQHRTQNGSGNRLNRNILHETLHLTSETSSILRLSRLL